MSIAIVRLKESNAKPSTWFQLVLLSLELRLHPTQIILIAHGEAMHIYVSFIAVEKSTGATLAADCIVVDRA